MALECHNVRRLITQELELLFLHSSLPEKSRILSGFRILLLYRVQSRTALRVSLPWMTASQNPSL